MGMGGGDGIKKIQQISMKETTKMIKRMERVFSPGLVEMCTKVPIKTMKGKGLAR